MSLRWCIDCHSQFRARHDYEKRCYRCWLDRRNQQALENPPKEYRCRDCGRVFHPTVPYATRCHECWTKRYHDWQVREFGRVLARKTGGDDPDDE